MFICDKKYNCCDHKYWDKLEDVDDDYARGCQHLIEVAPVIHGRWVLEIHSYSTPKCSICGWNIPYSEDSIFDVRNYCPNCGTKMDANFGVNIDCADNTKDNRIEPRWIYETGIESPEILGSGSSFSSVATISNEDEAKEAYKKGGRNYLLRYKYDNARRITQYWNGSNWESH